MNTYQASASDVSLVRSHDGTESHMNGRTDWPPPPRKRSQLVEALFPKSLACRLYLMVVILETIFDLAIEAILLARVNNAIDASSKVSEDDSPTLARSRIPVYLGVFGMAHVFQFVLALDAVYYKNVLQFVFLAIFNALFFVRFHQLLVPAITSANIITFKY